MFFRILKHLLPRARAWRLTIEKQLRQLFEGLAGTGSDIKDYVDLVWLDIFPDTTRELDLWDEQWGLPNTLTTDQARRDRLNATWQALGGQNPRYIQDTLRAAGFDVYVHEWWVPGSEPTPGTKAAATARDPFTYLDDGATVLRFYACDGGADMQDGDLALAMDGAKNLPAGYPLVNKILEATFAFIGEGNPGMQDGGGVAQDGGQITTYAVKQYALPADPTKYPYFLYIGGATFPNQANVPVSRKNEFETLCLKICPSHLWLGILVDYS